jgi:hypothetical protein
MYDLEVMKNIDINSVSINELADIQNVSVISNLTKTERVAEYIRQLKNPYCFRIGAYKVKAVYAEDGVSLEDCLRGILL